MRRIIFKKSLIARQQRMNKITFSDMWYLSYIMYSLLLLYISFIFDSLHKGYKYVLCIMYAIFLRADNHRQILLSIRLDPRRPTSHKYRHNSSAFLVVTVVICLRLIYPQKSCIHYTYIEHIYTRGGYTHWIYMH